MNKGCKAHATKALLNAGRTLIVAAINALILQAFFGTTQTADANEIHPHADIEATAENYARSANRSVDGRVDAVARSIDDRVRMPACGQPLDASIPYGKPQATRLTVEVRCAAPSPWKIYVPVRMAIFQQVAVAARPLARGNILAPGDIILTESDTGLLSRGFIVNPDHVMGQKLRRAIQAGDPITPSALETPAIIKRGQLVSLEARTGGLNVRMQGTAKSDGIIGQVIEFENQSSKRVVQAIVRSPQSAEILMQ